MDINTFKIQGLELSYNKNILYSCCYIPGLNKYRIKLILLLSGISAHKKIKEFSKIEKQEFRKILDRLEFSLTTNLLKGVKESKYNLWTLRLLRGYRLNKGLPVRGQKTKNNYKTAKKLNKL
nr:ribosomal protein S13 [Coccidia sp. AB-2023a]